METLHVVLCGREGDTRRVQGVLHGSITMPHVAWRRKYVFACTTVRHMRDVAATLLDVCHVIVVCSGNDSHSRGRHQHGSSCNSHTHSVSRHRRRRDTAATTRPARRHDDSDDDDDDDDAVGSDVEDDTASDKAADDDDDEDVSCYGNRPVLVLDTATTSSRAARLMNEECYYGVCTLAALRVRVLHVALTPTHLLYDALLRCLTPCGVRAYHRAFWLLDIDGDGLLTRDEVRAWRRQTTTAAAGNNNDDDDDDVTAVLREAAEAEAEAVHVNDNGRRSKSSSSRTSQEGNGNTTTATTRTAAAAAATADADVAATAASSSRRDSLCEGAFVALHTRWLAHGEATAAWATLQLVGTQPTHRGLPYTWHDLHSVRVDAETNTYLSAHAVQFFRGVYKLRYVRDAARLWSVTPGCPWQTQPQRQQRNGHTNGDDDDDEDDDDVAATAAHHTMTAAARSSSSSSSSSARRLLSLDAFIEHWKYLALERRDVVVRYARCWGYKGSSSSLLVRRHCRAARAADEVPPDTIQVLVVGARGCGKRTLIDVLTANEDDDDDDEEACDEHSDAAHEATLQPPCVQPRPRHADDDDEDSKHSYRHDNGSRRRHCRRHGGGGAAARTGGGVRGGVRYDGSSGTQSHSRHTQTTAATVHDTDDDDATAAPQLYVRTTTRLVRRRVSGNNSDSTAAVAFVEEPQTIIYTTIVSPSRPRRRRRRTHTRHSNNNSSSTATRVRDRASQQRSHYDSDDNDSDDNEEDSDDEDGAHDAATVVLCNASLNKTFDVVLLCCDAATPSRSTRYAASLYTRAMQSHSCVRMPFVVVLTKCDVLVTRATLPLSRHAASTRQPRDSDYDGAADAADTADAMAQEHQQQQQLSALLHDNVAATAAASSSVCATTTTTAAAAVGGGLVHTRTTPLPPLLLRDGVREHVAVLRRFCQAHQLLWPPVLASTHPAHASNELTLLSEYMFALACTPDLAIAPPPLTPVRVLRRATLAAMLLVLAAAAAQSVASYVRLRRRRAA